jgi:aspartate aminotransferase
MLAPGTGFYITKGLGKQEVRIAYVLQEEDLRKAINIIKEALVVYTAKEAV